MFCPTCQSELTPTTDGGQWCTQCGEKPAPSRAVKTDRPITRPIPIQPGPNPFAGKAAAARQPYLPPFVLPLAAVVILALVIVVVGRRGGSDAPTSESLPVQSLVPSAGAVVTDREAPSGSVRGKIASQIEKAMPARNQIERARNATVFIKTPSGVGSGFFINQNCSVLTNRHVIDVGRGRIDAMQEELFAAEEQVGEARRFVEEKKEAFRRRCTDCSETAWEKYLGADLQTLRESEDLIAARRNEILDLQFHGEMVAVLADGTEHPLETVQISERYDLALMRVAKSGCPALRPASSEDLELGASLYTVGSPRGLRHKVTSGIFSGFIESESGDVLSPGGQKARVIQTDAPINPGNSGGPLIDDQGDVVGINSAVLRDSQGIGLAIPIELALDEFGLR